MIALLTIVLTLAAARLTRSYAVAWRFLCPGLGSSSEKLMWRGQRADIARREDEAGLPAGTFARIQARIGSRHYWRESYRVGIWSRRAS